MPGGVRSGQPRYSSVRVGTAPVVGAVRNHVAMHQREDAGEILVGERRATLTKCLYDLCNLDGVPNQDGVRDQTQGPRPVHNLLVIAGPEPLSGRQRRSGALVLLRYVKELDWSCEFCCHRMRTIRSR